MQDEYFVDGRRHLKIYCDVCKKYLGATGPMEVKTPTREEFSSGLCDNCRRKAESGAVTSGGKNQRTG